MNGKSHRRAAALGQKTVDDIRRGIRSELDLSSIDAAFPWSILVYEPDGTETLIGEGPIAAVMSRAALEKIKALPEVRERAKGFRFAGIEFEEYRG